MAKKKNVEEKRVQRLVDMPLSDEKLAAVAKQYTECWATVRELENAKREATKDFKQQIDAMMAGIERLREKVESGVESVMRDCIVVSDYEAGTVVTIVVDTAF